MSLYRVHLSGLKDQYTGKIAKISFVDGLSEPVTWTQAMSIGAVATGRIYSEDGSTSYGLASPAEQAAANATWREEEPRETITPSTPALEPLNFKNIHPSDIELYVLSDADAGCLLNVGADVKWIEVPDNLSPGFYCSLRQATDSQFYVESWNNATIEEIDDAFWSEKRLAILHLAMLPDGTFQLTGRTTAEENE